MTYEIPGKMLPREASGDLSANQYCAVVLDANGRIALAGAGVSPYGVLQTKPGALGRAANVMINGVTKAVAGAPITGGAAVEVDANGHFIPHNTGKIAGYAEAAAVNTLDLFPMRMFDN